MDTLINRLREAALHTPGAGGLMQEAAAALEESERIQAELDAANEELRYWANR